MLLKTLDSSFRWNDMLTIFKRFRAEMHLWIKDSEAARVTEKANGVFGEGEHGNKQSANALCAV